MKKVFLYFVVLLVNSAAFSQESKDVKWSFNASLIEACSCPMFCQCYFNTKPAAHHTGHHSNDASEHFCKFNIAAFVNEGYYGETNLSGVKFWQAGDTGLTFPGI